MEKKDSLNILLFEKLKLVKCSEEFWQYLISLLITLFICVSWYFYAVKTIQEPQLRVPKLTKVLNKVLICIWQYKSATILDIHRNEKWYWEI